MTIADMDPLGSPPQPMSQPDAPVPDLRVLAGPCRDVIERMESLAAKIEENVGGEWQVNAADILQRLYGMQAIITPEPFKKTCSNCGSRGRDQRAPACIGEIGTVCRNWEPQYEPPTAAEKLGETVAEVENVGAKLRRQYEQFMLNDRLHTVPKEKKHV